MVDGMIELTLDRNAQRTVREIEVLKFRGGDHLLGRHDMEISRDGLVVRPRTEMLLARRTAMGQATHYRRVSTGIAPLDEMLRAAACSPPLRPCSSASLVAERHC